MLNLCILCMILLGDGEGGTLTLTLMISTKHAETQCACICVYVCVCVRERERERERIVGYVAACASLGSETVRLERVAITMFILSMCGCLLVQNRSAECVWLWLETNKKKTIQRIVSHFIVLFSYHQYFG